MTTRIAIALLCAAAAAPLLAAGCREPAELPAAPQEVGPGELAGLRVAVLIAEGFHDGETLEPIAYLSERGAAITVLGPEVGEPKAYNSDTRVTIEMPVSEARAEDFHGLILPGGQGPARLREHPPAVDFARAFVESGKPVAAICHGPQLLVTAGVVAGRRMTGVGGIAAELRAGGAEYLDQEVVRDGNLITSRTPPDLPAFNAAIAQALRELKQQLAL